MKMGHPRSETKRNPGFGLILIVAIGTMSLLALAEAGRAQNPVPYINSISPVASVPGSAGFTLTVNGAGFAPGAAVNWGKGASQTPLVTSFVSATKLTATVPGSLVVAPGTALIAVSNPGGEVSSNALLFPITTPSTTVSMGGPDFAIGQTPASSVVGDFNGDGKPDVAELVNGGGNTATIALLFGNGDGTFNLSLGVTTSFGTVQEGFFSSRSIVAGDFNGDGKTDLAVLFTNPADTTCASGGYLGILLGNGDGTFTALPASACVGINPVSIVVADFNGDGELDVAVANNCGPDPQGDCGSPGDVSVLLGNGDGTFTTAPSPAAGPLPQAITAGDFNGDGQIDLAVSDCLGECFGGQVTILLGKGNGTFTATATSPPTGSVPNSIAAADLNGDGILDLVVANGCGDGSNCELGSITVLMGNGDATFTPLPTLNLNGTPDAISVGDFDGDGKLDVMVGGASFLAGGGFTGSITFLHGNGDGSFRVSSAPLGPSGFTNALSAGDFDGDGKLDLALAEFPSNATILLQSLGATLSPASLVFSPQPVGSISAAQSVTVTNTGTRAEPVGAIAVVGDFGADVVFSQTNNCGALLVPGAGCTINVTFEPPRAGVWPGHVSINISQGERSIALTGVGGPGAFLLPSSLSFPLTLDTATSAPQTLRLQNITSLPAPITSIKISGGFFQSNDCAGAVPPQGFCSVFVSFAPTVAGPITGSLTATVQTGDVSISLTAALSGAGTALQLGPTPSFPVSFDALTLGATSTPQTVTVTDVSTQPLKLDGITIAGNFSEHDNCGRTLSPGASCIISVSFKPLDDGPNQGTLTINAEDPSSPQTFQLIGTGLGTLRGVVFLHYDYLVAPDHTHDPEVLAPGAIQQVVETFARHGITLVIDPHHTAIPEIAPPANTFPFASTIVFGNGNCGAGQGLMNFNDLKAAYYQARNPRAHYTIFGHAIANSDPSDPFSCAPFFYSGLSELPGQNFVIGLASLDLGSEISASLQTRVVAGSFMHEFGHNLGLHHGGGLGPLDADDTNLKPNYLSVMNYNYIFRGIPEADALGSAKQRSCSTDRDCGAGASCIDAGIKPGPPVNVCLRLDYSRQLLPTGGNTPGALDETDLNEPAGLGSGNADLFFYPIHGCHDIQMAPSNGPVDWDDDASATNLHTQANLLMDVLFERCSAPLETVRGFDDWKALMASLDATEAMNESNAGAPQPVAPELDMQTVRQQHLLYPARPAQMQVHPGCALASAPLTPGQPGTVTIAIPANGSLDVKQIELSSLSLHGLQPSSATLTDTSGARRPDLVLTFDSAQLHLSPQKKEVRLSGWLKNGQLFVASAPVTIVNDMSTQPAACRN
jgi:hypothetical protein